MKLLARLAVILAGFLASAAAAGVAIVLLFGIFSLKLPVTGAAFEVALIASLYIAVLTFIPAMIVALIAEYSAIRRLRFFLVSSGVLALLFGSLLFWPSPRNPEPGFLLAIFCAGPVAGWVYWHIAGRTAGLWRETQDRA